MANPTISLEGMIVTEPETRMVAGTTKARFRVVTSDRRKTADEEWEDQNTTFWTVEAWGTLAEKVGAHLENKDPVLVTGKVYEEKWLSKDGEERTSLTIRADEIGLNLRRVKR